MSGEEIVISKIESKFTVKKGRVQLNFAFDERTGQVNILTNKGADTFSFIQSNHGMVVDVGEIIVTIGEFCRKRWKDNCDGIEL